MLSLLAQFALAKDITVIFNFPEGASEDVEELVSLPEDANAFHAFATVAGQKGLEMDMTYYPGFGSWFINGINGVNNTAGQYWHFWVNNEASMAGISAHIPQNRDIIELGFADEPRGIEKNAAENALEWLIANQQANGEIGSHKTWGNAFALMALNLFEGNETVKQKAAQYLLSNQQEDAGFAYPGFDSDALHTAAATMALIANDQNIESFAKGNTSSIDFLLSKQENDGGFSGWEGSDADTTSWAILAFEAAKEQLPAKNSKTPIDYLLSAQNSDGGFGYQIGQNSAEDYTAEALTALASTQKDSRINNALNWLKQQQNSTGCFSNAYTTALGAMALMSYSEDANSCLQCLKTLQLPDNGFGRNGTSNAVDTALAVIALSEKTLPTKKQAAGSTQGIIPIGSIAKFTVEITNHGKVPARNVSISLNGIPNAWIQQQTSTLSIAEIKPNETKQAEIYVNMNETGNYEVYASASSPGIAGTVNSNLLQLEIAAAQLSVILSMQ